MQVIAGDAEGAVRPAQPAGSAASDSEMSGADGGRVEGGGSDSTSSTEVPRRG